MLCQVQVPDALNVHSIEVVGDLAYLTIIIPESLLSDFQGFLRSTLSISSYIQKQARIKKAIQKAHDLTFQEEQRKRFADLSVKVTSQVKTHLKSGLTERQAIRKAKECLNDKGYSLTCAMIELIVREEKRQSKEKRKEERINEEKCKATIAEGTGSK